MATVQPPEILVVDNGRLHVTEWRTSPDNEVISTKMVGEYQSMYGSIKFDVNYFGSVDGARTGKLIIHVSQYSIQPARMDKEFQGHRLTHGLVSITGQLLDTLPSDDYVALSFADFKKAIDRPIEIDHTDGHGTMYEILANARME